MSDKYKGIYRGQTFRLQQWDYGSEGLYFITICTQNREHFFGEINGGIMNLSDIGGIVESEWLKTPSMRPDMNLELVEFVVMPNHFHAIIYIGANEYNNSTDENCRDAMHCVPTISPSDSISSSNPISLSEIIPIQTKKSKNQFGPQSKNLASIVRGFKSAVTTWCRKNNYPNFKWQPLYYDHVIRNQQAFEKIQRYIIDNPKNWKDDRFYE